MQQMQAQVSPVSYTHLDVYKRQTEIDLDEKLNTFRNICRTIHRFLKNKRKNKEKVFLTL